MSDSILANGKPGLDFSIGGQEIPGSLVTLPKSQYDRPGISREEKHLSNGE